MDLCDILNDPRPLDLDPLSDSGADLPTSNLTISHSDSQIQHAYQQRAQQLSTSSLSPAKLQISPSLPSLQMDGAFIPCEIDLNSGSAVKSEKRTSNAVASKNFRDRQREVLLLKQTITNQQSILLWSNWVTSQQILGVDPCDSSRAKFHDHVLKIVHLILQLNQIIIADHAKILSKKVWSYRPGFQDETLQNNRLILQRSLSIAKDHADVLQQYRVAPERQIIEAESSRTRMDLHDDVLQDNRLIQQLNCTVRANLDEILRQSEETSSDPDHRSKHDTIMELIQINTDQLKIAATHSRRTLALDVSLLHNCNLIEWLGQIVEEQDDEINQIMAEAKTRPATLETDVRG